jgi:excisionase family DNA binding protein
MDELQKMSPRIISPREAAAALGISIKTLRGHVKDGTIRYIAIGRGRKRPHIGFTRRISTNSRKHGGADKPRGKHVRLQAHAEGGILRV